jgi:hypothetical protein
MTSVPCPVLGANITQVADFEGHVTHVICPEYETNGTCRLKKSAQQQGPLGQLLERVSRETLSSRGTSCIFLAE